MKLRMTSPLLLAAAALACAIAASASAQPAPRPQAAVRETFRGACGGAWRDSVDRTEECARTQRPVCYSNGACRCEDDTRCR